MKTKILLITSAIIILCYTAYDLLLYPISFSKNVNSYSGTPIQQVRIKAVHDDSYLAFVGMYDVRPDGSIDVGISIKDRAQIAEIEKLLRGTYLVRKTRMHYRGEATQVIRLMSDNRTVIDEYFITTDDTILVGELGSEMNSFGSYEYESVLRQKTRIQKVQEIIEAYE